MRSKTTSPFKITEWHIDIDRFINPYILPSPASRLPTWLGRFLGYRREPPRPLGNVIVSVWSFLGTLASLSLIFIVNKQLSAFENREAPLILASFVNESSFPQLFRGLSLFPKECDKLTRCNLKRERQLCLSIAPLIHRLRSHATSS